MKAKQKVVTTRMVQPKHHDTYKAAEKPRQPTACKVCNAVFHEGRWSWKAALPSARTAVCPACQRIADHFPAGRVEIGGAFFRVHRDEILNLVHNEEQSEKQERPLERIMAIENDAGTTIVTTTGTHIARRIGEALARSYQGTYDYTYSNGEDAIRVSWSR